MYCVVVIKNLCRSKGFLVSSTLRILRSIACLLVCRQLQIVNFQNHNAFQNILRNINFLNSSFSISLLSRLKLQDFFFTSNRNLLQSDLTLTSHKNLFDLLLFVEEIQMEVDIRKYDMEKATMDYANHNKRLLTLKVWVQSYRHETLFQTLTEVFPK